MGEANLAILYEHEEWFRPLFAELERRDIVFDRLPAAEFGFDPRIRSSRYKLLVNRMSPSAYLRGHANAIFFVREFLRHMQQIGVPVLNGPRAYEVETSKALQLDILERVGVAYPRARVINHPAEAVAAAQGLTYPVIVKPNIGGSGAKIQRFEERATLAAAARSGTLDLGVDSVALVQEFLPARGGCIVRVEVMDGKFLYAIKIVPPAQGGFNLCPADICQEEGNSAAPAEPAAAPDFAFCPAAEPARRTMQIENFSPPPEIIDAALRIAREASLDIGGMEYLINDRDGQPYFYDINALSNFVTDAPRIVGFDPFPRFVDFIERRMKDVPRP
jgi:hypothetical protein